MWLCLLGGPAAAQQPDTAILAQIRASALAASPEITAARAALDFSQARLGAAGFAAPVVLAAEVEEVPGGYQLYDPGSARVVLEKVFLAPGQRTAARALADAERTAAQARLAAAERRILARTELALVRAVGWAAIADRLVEQDSLLSSAAASLRTRFAVGQASYVDVLRLRTEQLRVQVAQAEAVAESRAARRVIEAILPPGDSAARRALAQVDELVQRAPTRALMAMLSPPPEIDSLLSTAGAVRLAEAEVRQARAQRELLLALQRPQLGGFVGAQRFRSDDGSHSLGPVLGAAVSLPFTAARANRTSANAARLQVAAAEANLAATRTTLRADLLAARERYQAALARLAVFDAALLQAARAERESALAAYRSGQISLTELLDFERGLSLAESERIQSEIAAAQALADLVSSAYATGELPGPSEIPAGAPPGGS